MSLIHKTNEDDTIPETPRPDPIPDTPCPDPLPEPTPDEWDDQYADDPRR